MILILSLILLIGVPLQLWTFHKVRKMALRSYTFEQNAQRDRAQLFSQLESLFGIYATLRPSMILPPTRGWAASPDFLRNIIGELHQGSRECVVECSSGVSTLVIARSLQLLGKGHVYSLEHDPLYAEATRHYLKTHQLEMWATVVDAPLTSVTTSRGEFRWYSSDAVPALPEIDLLVIDGPPNLTGQLARYPAGPILFPRLSKSGTVLLDDADREDECEIVRLWALEFTQLIASRIPSEKGLVRLSSRSGAA